MTPDEKALARAPAAGHISTMTTYSAYVAGLGTITLPRCRTLESAVRAAKRRANALAKQSGGQAPEYRVFVAAPSRDGKELWTTQIA